MPSKNEQRPHHYSKMISRFMYLDQIMVLCSLKRRVRKVTKVLSVDDLSKAVKLD